MSLWKKQIEKGFDAAAASYDAYSAVQFKAAANLSALCPALDKADILEIGCGTGALTKNLLGQYPHARFHITDISPAMLAQAQDSVDDHAGIIKWSTMDGEQPCLDQKYDLIVSNMAFQWLEDRQAALHRLSQSLKSGGRILYSLPGPESFKEWLETLSALNLPSGILEFDRPNHIIKETLESIKYDSALHFLKSMKHIGAHRPKKGYRPLSVSNLKTACCHFDKHFHGTVSWHIIYADFQWERHDHN